ncbi:MAG: TIR domain-containing protein, partial [Methylobacteriaceae bacterium]|nr:TIR domain-containing protein [Methylobacteriaceae bacterium]
MARHTFFSFHYERDIWRASQIRNSWVTQDREAAGFWDKAEWEEIKKKGEAAVHNWIDEQLKGTSVTVVLIGAETSTRTYVDYEITQSHKKKKGILGIYIHNLKDKDQKTGTKGANPFGKWKFTDSDGNVVTYPTYDWMHDEGYENMGD